MHLWILLAALLAQTTPPPTSTPADTPSTGTYAPPATQPGDDGWLRYDKAPTWMKDTVDDLAPGAATPEAAVVHYLASRVRGDKRHEEVLPPTGERGDRLNRKLAEHDRWTFHAFRLVSRKDRESGELWIKVWMRISMENDMDSGEDEFTVICGEDGCIVTGVPT